MPSNLQWWNAFEAVGLFILWGAGVWMVISNAWWRNATGDDATNTEVQPTPIGIVEEYPEGLSEAHGSPPTALKLFIGIWAIWAVGYVVLYFVK
jgi:hypothetical protein